MYWSSSRDAAAAIYQVSRTAPPPNTCHHPNPPSLLPQTNGNCSGDVDSLDEPSLDRGLFALTSRYMDEVRLLSDDDVIDLTDTNSR